MHTSAFFFKKAPVVVEDPPEINNENTTYVQDVMGNMYKVDINEVKNVSSPSFSAETDVTFELYTLENPTEPQILSLQNFSAVFESNFHWYKPTRFFIHGWNSHGSHTPKFINAYLNKGKFDMNLIVVNWRKGSDVYFYHMARRRVNEVAVVVARFIDRLHDKTMMGIENLKIIGHSLGAHISGISKLKRINFYR